jgi:hypothetical protein
MALDRAEESFFNMCPSSHTTKSGPKTKTSHYVHPILKISNSFALAAKEDRKTCKRFPFLPVSKKKYVMCMFIYIQ